MASRLKATVGSGRGGGSKAVKQGFRCGAVTVTIVPLNYGARIEQTLVPDRHGQLGDVVQGYETIDQVRSGQASMGAFIGRYANRIAHGRFTLENREYQLPLNSGPHSSHGGAKGAPST
jgi:galactose mutarotase-like enzyme